MNDTPWAVETHPNAGAALRWLVCAMTALVMLCVLAPPAPAGTTQPPGDVFGGQVDAVGDVTLDGSGPQYAAPDIRSFTAAYLDNSPDGPADDTVQATAVVDASSASGIDPRIFAGRVVAWWIDGDGNAATGYPDEDFGRGADYLVIAFGTQSGVPVVAHLRPWANGAFQRTGVTIPLVNTGSGFGWSQPASAFGAGRGRNLRVWVEAAKIDTVGVVVQADRSPDSLQPLVLPVPPPPPTAQTGTVAAVGPTTAQVAGIVDAGGSSTQWFVRYGVGSVNDGATVPQAIAGSGPAEVSAQLSDLKPGTEYSYQVIARSAWGESAGEVRTFTTDAVAVAGEPVVTGAARRVTPTSAELTGTVAVAGGSWWFEYGRTTAYGQRTGPVPVTGDVPQQVVTRVGGLEPGLTYHFRLVVEVDGTGSVGADATLRTTPVGRMLITGKAAGSCRAGACTLRRLDVLVRGRDAGGRVLKGAALRRGVTVTARCISRCGVRRVVRLRGTGTVLSGRLAGLTRGVRLKPGATIEVRVVRKGYLGAVYRVTTGGKAVRSRTCALTLAGAARCGTGAAGR